MNADRVGSNHSVSGRERQVGSLETGGYEEQFTCALVEVHEPFVYGHGTHHIQSALEYLDSVISAGAQ